MATKLCDAMAGGSSVRRFAFRALAPVFDTTPIRLVHGAGGTSGSGVIERSDGVTSMRATLELA
jgi:3-methylfumaryl-CoA hydratase